MQICAVVCAVVIAVCVHSAVAFAYHIDRNRPTRSIEGNVLSVDWVGSKIVVKVDGNDEMTFTVAEDAQVIRAGETIGLDDLLQNDPVTITYYNASPGPLVAVSVSDSNDANR